MIEDHFELWCKTCRTIKVMKLPLDIYGEPVSPPIACADCELTLIEFDRFGRLDLVALKKEE